jgi:hypothetical protein
MFMKLQLSRSRVQATSSGSEEVREMRSQRIESLWRGSKSRCKQWLPYQNFLTICLTTSLPWKAKVKSKKAKEVESSFLPFTLPFAFRLSRQLPSCGLSCHPPFGTDPTRPALPSRPQHQQTHPGRESESHARGDRRRIVGQIQHVRK